MRDRTAVQKQTTKASTCLAKVKNLVLACSPSKTKRQNKDKNFISRLVRAQNYATEGYPQLRLGSMGATQGSTAITLLLRKQEQNFCYLRLILTWILYAVSEAACHLDQSIPVEAKSPPKDVGAFYFKNLIMSNFVENKNFKIYSEFKISFIVFS